MKTEHKIEKDGSISITLNFKPEGSMLQQEEQIAQALAEAGRIATALSLRQFDTDGRPIVVNNVKHTSRGQEKKTTKHPTGK
jgi:hypothetical protein